MDVGNAIPTAPISRPTTEPESTTTTTTSLSSDEHDCGNCLDTGYATWKTPYSYPMREVKFCDCELGERTELFWEAKHRKQQNERLSELFEVAGIPPRFRDYTLETLRQAVDGGRGKESAIAAAKAMIANGYIEQDGRRKFSLLLTGDYGTGKTGALTPVLRYWLDQGKSGLWIEFYDFCDRVQAGYGRGDSDEVMEAAKTADWILLDDMGELQRDDRSTGFAETTDRQKILYQLVNYRHNHMLPMLITSNLRPAQLAKQFGARTFERLMESCVILHMSGKNLRA